MRPPLEPNKKARSGWCTRTSFLLLLGAKTVISRLAKMFYFNNMYFSYFGNGVVTTE